MPEQVRCFTAVCFAMDGRNPKYGGVKWKNFKMRWSFISEEDRKAVYEWAKQYRLASDKVAIIKDNYVITMRIKQEGGREE